MPSADASSPFDRMFETYFEAYGACDASGCAAAFSSDAVLLHPWGEPAAGRTEIAARHEEWFDEGETNKGWQIDYWRAAGDFGTCLVAFASDLPYGSRTSGHTLAAMERRDSLWLIRAASITTIP